jgi:hypothetical protein
MESSESSKSPVDESLDRVRDIWKNEKWEIENDSIIVSSRQFASEKGRTRENIVELVFSI